MRGMVTPQTFGEWMKSQRARAGLTQRQVADAVGIDRSYVIKIEKGRVTLPQHELRHRIYGALGGSDAVLASFGLIRAEAQPDMDSRSTGVRLGTETDRADDADEEPPDPLLNVVMSGARRLTPAGRRMLVEQIDLIERLQREMETEEERDAPPDRRRR